MRSALPTVVLCLAAALPACGDDASSEPSAPAPEPPVSYARPELGAPVSDAELAAVTDDYLELLREIRYFDVTRERAHGWPASDPEGRYWYGTWWSGVSIVRENGAIKYLHGADGADNNGLRTAPLLEGALFAHAIWGHQPDLMLSRELIRGFSSWILAMQSAGHPDAGVLMTRAHYPDPVTSTDDGVDVLLDYSLNRPGLDNGATEYVHVPDNPHWGDIWVKNKRSKDDLGHMMRAIAHVSRLPREGVDPGLRDDADEMLALYRAWAQRVEDDDWTIATYDASLGVFTPPDDLAHLIQVLNGECDVILTLRLFARGDTGGWDCGNGITDVDTIASVKPSNAQMFRAYHEGLVAHAQLAGKNKMALIFLEGLAFRVESTLDALESSDPPDAPIPEDMTELLVQAANVGLPLTWREVRYVHERIREAHDSYLDGSQHDAIHALDEGMPDGTYPFEPSGKGFFFRNIGAVLGSCASTFRSENGKPILDCERVKAAQR
jgi:hypothetical protein